MRQHDINRINRIIKRLQALGTSLYMAPALSVDNALPRDIVSEAIDELVARRAELEKDERDETQCEAEIAMSILDLKIDLEKNTLPKPQPLAKGKRK